MLFEELSWPEKSTIHSLMQDMQSFPTPTLAVQPLPSRFKPRLRAIGAPEILNSEHTALFCSVRCPGDLILKTYDLARAMREAGTPVIGGFQTPMEKECLPAAARQLDRRIR